MYPKVSIITATYNSAHTLGTCIAAVASQDYPNIEHLIIDGASTDGTEALVKTASKTNANLCWYSEPDKGIYDALNKGIQKATGSIIGFLHSDDLFAGPDTITALVNAFVTQQPDGVYADLQYVDRQNTSKIIRFWKSQPFQQGLLKRGWMPAHPTLFLKPEVYKKHGCFNLDYTIAADYEFMLRLLKDQSLSFYYLPKVVTKMRVGGASNRSLKNIIQKTKEDYKAIRTHKLGNWFTIVLKNTSKVSQFFKR